MRILCIFFKPGQKQGGARNALLLPCLLGVFLLVSLCLLSGCKRPPEQTERSALDFPWTRCNSNDGSMIGICLFAAPENWEQRSMCSRQTAMTRCKFARPRTC